MHYPTLIGSNFWEMQIENYSQQKQTYLGGNTWNKNNSKHFFTENYNSFGASPLNQSPKKNLVNNLFKVTKNEMCIFWNNQKMYIFFQK